MPPSEDSPPPSSPASRSGSANTSAAWAAPSPEEIQALLQGYQVLELIGRGGMGAVYKARQISLDRTVAIKILPPFFWDDVDDYAERFRQEARVMAKMMHPGMVAVFDFGETPDGKLYFVMEYVEGTDVARMIDDQGSLSSDNAISIAAHVCDTLRYAHEKGIIHRDIKPANVMVDVEGKVKVADFGLAKMMAQELGLTRSDMTVGTPHFVAPEAVQMGAIVDGRADLYSLGVMLYQMLTGKLPRGVFTLPSQMNAGLDARYDDIVVRAMRAEPEARFASAAEFRQHLDLILAVPAAEYQQQKLQSARMAKRSRSKGLALGIILSCIALVAGGGYWYEKTHSTPKPELANSPAAAQDAPKSNLSSPPPQPSGAPEASQISSAPNPVPPSKPNAPLASETTVPPLTLPQPAPVALMPTAIPPAAPSVAPPADPPVPVSVPAPVAPIPAPQPPPRERPLDPVVAKRLDDLESAYRAAVQREVEPKHREAVATLEGHYLEAINRRLAAIHDQKESDALLTEKKLLSNHQSLPNESDPEVPVGLKGLRTTYRNALSKIEADTSAAEQPLRDRYEVVLTGYESELIKSGNIDGVAAVEDKLRKIAAAEVGPDVHLAGVEVEEATWGPLLKDESVYGESRKSQQWVQIPEFFNGFRVTKLPAKSATLHFKVTSDGIVFMACTNRWLASGNGTGKMTDLLSPAQLKAAGWRLLMLNLKSTETYPRQVYYRMCKAGEQFSCRTEKYVSPLLLLK